MGGTINVPISTEGSGTPTMGPNTGYPVYGLRAGGENKKEEVDSLTQIENYFLNSHNDSLVAPPITPVNHC